MPDTDDARPPQAKAPATQFFGAEAFAPTDHTELRWLGMAGWLMNSRGTTLMLDALLGGFDMPVMIDFPIRPEQVPHLDAFLATHSDADHYSVWTAERVADVTASYHGTRHVGSLMTDAGLPAQGHDVGDTFSVGDLRVTLTPADHAWQNEFPGRYDRVFAPEDCCGFWIETPDGNLWAPGDSRLIREHHLTMPAPDALLFDFSDSSFHFTLAGAVEMANAYPDVPLLLHHWGSVDAPTWSPFNGDPASLQGRVVNEDRIQVLAPGEPFRLTRR
ncbi:MBL fold metallo-hydrolase [Propioniciclava soli]|uniref:MBL fold metallo-hydrolase n=1 Tax=Propioniciclava soli TaxID=2775081 RepID=UPI001E3CC7B0|nr:MBL fold metallo-hydrolase [Propioniciclava soli]